MINQKKSIIDDVDFNDLLEQLPEDQRIIIMNYVTNLTTDFENNILKPLEKSLDDISK